MRTAQKIAFYFGLVNLFLGVSGFIGPFVTKNNDKVINLKPGLLFGVFGINWLHALVHVVTGIGGVLARTSNSVAQSYMWLMAIVYGAMAAMGWVSFGARKGIHTVMGMALDWKGNVVHTLYTLTGITAGLWKRDLYPERMLEEFKQRIEAEEPFHEIEHEVQRIAP